MKKSLKLVGLLVLAAIAVVVFVGPKEIVASTTGYLYGHGLYIQSVPGTTVASITNAGALTVTSVTNTGALGGSAITATTSVTSPLIVATGPIQFYSRTQAQIEATTATAVGQGFYCNDCTATSVCISSAANRTSWISVVNPATACD